ncbi:MAG: LysM peptidoglycan-binding domain-containing protein [Candidatus Marinimicrobia bacterium]|nr:LysM peptidoglycan-binding domain-containing protein [Candidatus Neomarinimicrobiota bacterium]
MSYAIRNSIILSVVLILLVTGGYFFIQFKYDKSIDKLVSDIEEKEQFVSKLNSILADYEYYDHELSLSNVKLDYYPKQVLPERLIHSTYRYFDKISTQRAAFNYTFKLIGTKLVDNVIYASFQLKGEGLFSNIAHFIYRLENGKPIYEIETITVRNKSNKEYSANQVVDVTLKIIGMFSDEFMQEDKAITRFFEEAFIFPGMILKIYQSTNTQDQSSHMVQAGESLKSIAQDYYGDANLWKTIYLLNQSEISNPNIIYVDQFLQIGKQPKQIKKTIHKVQPGETLSKIAQQYYGDFNAWEKIYSDNSGAISNPESINPGQVLVIKEESDTQAEIIHIVKPGESLSMIAKYYGGEGADWKELYQMNRELLSNPNKISPGIKLTVKQSEIKPSYLTHKVEPGETLRSLAANYLGDEGKWREIYNWNRSLINDQTDYEIIPQYDPFNPLISAKLPPNKSGLLDVNRAKLLALTNEVAYIQNQNGQMVEMRKGGKVYLGYLSSINLTSGKVYFKLDKGGIPETAVLYLNTSQKGQ